MNIFITCSGRLQHIYKDTLLGLNLQHITKTNATVIPPWTNISNFTSDWMKMTKSSLDLENFQTFDLYDCVPLLEFIWLRWSDASEYVWSFWRDVSRYVSLCPGIAIAPVCPAISDYIWVNMITCLSYMIIFNHPISTR